MFLRKNRRRKLEVSLEDSLNYDSNCNDLYLEDVLGTEDDLVTKKFENNLDKERLKVQINKLNKRDRQIMILRYGLNNNDEYTQKEVAEMLNISQSYISRIEKKIISKLQNALN